MGSEVMTPDANAAISGDTSALKNNQNKKAEQ